MLLHIYHWTWAGVSYRQDVGFIGLLGAKFSRHLALGYAYELPNNNWSPHASGTHEIHLGLHLGGRKDHVEHAHSFIKSHVKTSEDRRREAEERAAAEEQAAQEEAEKEAASEQEISEGETSPSATPETDDDLLADDFLDSLSFDEEPATPPAQASGDKPVEVPGKAVPDVPSPAPQTPEAVPDERAVEAVRSFAEEAVRVEEKVLPTEKGEPPWQPVVDEEPVLRSTPEGMERGVTLKSNPPAPGIKRYALGWVPMRKGESRQLDTELPLRRQKNAEGRDEIVAVWQVHDEQGAPLGEESIVFPVYSADELERVIREEGGVSAKTIVLRATDDKTRVGDSGVSLLGAIVKKGDHAMELPVGSYVVAGSFSKRGNAERFAANLRTRGRPVVLGYNSDVERYYVTVYESHDVERARLERDKLRKEELFSDVWVLTVVD